MLSEIATIFEEAIQATNIVDRWAGVVVPLEQSERADNGTFKREVFPVSCTIPGACQGEGVWKKVTPDESLRGLAYVEQRGNASINTLNASFVRMTYPVRLIVWVNLGSQGLDNCGDVIAQAELIIINCLNNTKTVALDWLSADGRAVIRDFSILPKVPGRIFQGYTFAQENALYFWPFGFTAIDCNVIFDIPSNCVEGLNLTEKVECITY